jgi:hypothetical protein
MDELKFDAADEAHKPMETTGNTSEPVDSSLQENYPKEVLQRLEELGYIDAGLDI